MLANHFKRRHSILLLHLLGLCLYHLFAYIGHYGFDDMQYAELANDLLQGKFNADDHFSYRLVPIALTSISYALFGINDFASSFPPLLASGFILYLLYQIQKKKGNFILSISLSFCLISNWYLAYSGKLMPDIFLALFFFLALYYYHNYRYLNKGKDPFKYAFWFTLALFLGFNTKGTIVLILPILMYFFVLDITLRRDWKFWAYSLGIGLTLLLLYFGISELLSGEFSKRFEAIYANSYLNHCSYDQQSYKILLKRIGRDLFLLLNREGLFLSFAFVLAGLIRLNFKSLLKIDDSKHFWFSTATLALLSSNFTSISLNAYNPMCLDARHYLFLVPLFAIPAAGVAEEYIFKRRHFQALIITLISLGYIYYFDSQMLLFNGYIYLAFVLVLFYFLPLKLTKRLFPIFLILALSSQVFQSIQYGQDVDYPRQRALIHSEVIEKLDKGYLISDPVQTRIARYYQGFQKNPKLKFISYQEADTTEFGKNPIYLLSNRHTQNLLFYPKHQLPLYVRYHSEAEELLFEDKKLGLSLRKIPGLIGLDHRAELIFESINDFEVASKYWNHNASDLQSTRVHKGTQAMLIPQYSSTFVYPLDSLDLNSGTIYIDAQVYCWTADNTKASLVISIETSEGSIHYESTPIKAYLSSYSAWWPVKLNLLVPSKEIPQGASLKVYLFNPDLNSIYADDFRLKLQKLP